MLRPKLLMAAVGVGLMVGLHALGWLRPVERAVRYVIFPASRAVYQLSADRPDSEESFFNPEARAAYKTLRERYQSLVVDEARQKLLEEENQELRRQLQFLEARRLDSIGAEVVGRSSEPLRQTRWINRGRRDGIAVGQPAIVRAGVLVGKVIAVEETAALIQLLTDHRSRVAATVLNGERSLGVIEGGYGISIRMNLIPQNEAVNVGETVLTSGAEPGIPRGLLIGTIETVEKEAFQPFQRASVLPLSDSGKIQVVSIITASSAPK